MAVELKQQLRLSQQLVMTPQLQQAIKLLQLSRLEMLAAVQHELEQNPLLEEAPDFEDAPGEAESAAGDGSSEMRDGEAEAAEFAGLDWRDTWDAPPAGSSVVRDAGAGERSEAPQPARRETLQEHLHWQLRFAAGTPELRLAAACIVGNLDGDGYLRTPLAEIAAQCGAAPEQMEAALRCVQGLDPPGVAARDLRECLLLQLGAGAGARANLARCIVARHLDELQRRDLRSIERQTGATPEAVAEAARFIAGLEPRPARGFGGDEPIYIVPDVSVHRIGGEFHVALEADGLPRLRVSRLYRDLLSGAQAAERETRDYVQEKMRAALWLIRSIHQRQRTIYRVMESIVRHQRAFFEQGPAQLRPLKLRDVAEDIGMHESTVSRVTTSKYASTPQGIFELKYFFNSRINRVDGEAIASEGVKEHIRRIITGEDARRPLSDQRIAEALRSQNIAIARRTVTKYREAMKILSSTRRRRVG